MKNIEHLFFDLDHTLWDFDKNSAETLSELFVELELNAHISNMNAFIQVYQQINAKYWDLYNHGKVSKSMVRTGRFKDTLDHFKVPKVDELADIFGAAYIDRSPKKRHVFEGAYETLAYLKERYQLHIITNGFTEVQYSKLNNCDLTHFFDLILCTEEVGVNKPNPLVFQTALERTNALASKSIMIGDNPETDIKGAQNCGLHTILFNPHSAHYEVDSIQINALKELTNLL